MNKMPAIPIAQLLTRGISRHLRDCGFDCLQEFKLADRRRADVIGLNRKGEFSIVEIKSSVADFQSDNKWTEYLVWCDRFYFGVGADFPVEILPQDVGLIIADAYGGETLREPDFEKLPAVRRKALTLRFAQTAARRLQADRETGIIEG